MERESEKGSKHSRKASVSESERSEGPRLDDFVALEKIGKGSFGSVFKIKRVKDGKILVWKELYYGQMSEEEKQQLVCEVNVLRQIGAHKHVVRYFDRIIDRANKKIFLIMEFCAGGDLASLIKQTKAERKHLDEKFVWKVFSQIVSALAYCHRTTAKGRVLHRDLKPANVFLDEHGNVKLGDFGLARILENSRAYAQTHVGTPYYMSPEQVTEMGYNDRSDIWSLGCLVYELAALLPPFRASNQLALVYVIKRGKFASLPAQYSAELSRAVRQMLNVVPTERPSVKDLLRLEPIKAALASKKTPTVAEITSESKSGTMGYERQLEQRERDCEQREARLQQKENALHALEKRLHKWERALRVKQAYMERDQERLSKALQENTENTGATTGSQILIDRKTPIQ